MDLYPAVDVQGGRVVRVRRTDAHQATAYADDPLAVAAAFAHAGARWVHFVDLDRAFGRGDNRRLARAFLAAAQVPVQVGGGLRSEEAIAEMFAWGATRVVIGTTAATDPALVARLLARHGAEHPAIGIDAQEGRGAGVRRLTPALALLRVTGVAALALLLWNPAVHRDLPGGDQPLILLDASLSMAGAPWRAALDTAHALARAQHGVIWRFGDRVTAFDTAPPGDGASRLGPALDAAAARGGPVIVVTDGDVGDAADLPADLRARARLIVVPRPDFFDAFVASVSGSRRLTTGDTLTLEVTVGTAGKRERGMGHGKATLTVSVAGRRLAARGVTLPDRGTITTGLTIPPSRFPSPGWSALQVRLEGVGDSEPRDDARLFVVQVSAQPAAVVVASPPDWEPRFLAPAPRALARVPLK